MRPENHFRAGDRVAFKGTRRFQELHKGPYVYTGHNRRLLPDGPARGRVLRIWRKGWRHMVDVEFEHFGNYVLYPDELEFDLLHTLAAL